MKRITAAFLLSIMVFSATDFRQVGRLPLLVQHFIKHRSETSNFSLVSLLKEHYLESFKNDKDWQEDAKLPLKHTNNLCKALSFFVPANNVVTTPAPASVSFIKKKYFSPFIENITTVDNSNFWHPPRLTA